MRIALGLLVMALAGSGCATVPYHALDRAYGPGPVLAPGEPQVEQGRPVSVVDGLGQLFSIPSKLILWDRRVDNHRIGSNTVMVLRSYLDHNRLTNVKVRVNQYAPGPEFGRLVRNRAVGAGWRYTVGVLSWVVYAILPGRIIGGDHYNPFSHTINLYSDHPAIALHEGAHARDLTCRTYKGTYAVAGMLPLVPLYHESIATGDVMGYLQEAGNRDSEREAYRILYPAYGTYIGGEFARWNPAVGLVWTVAGAIPGHVVGRYRARQVRDPDGPVGPDPGEPLIDGETVDR
ncbi:MAG: hypothetical protein A2498_12775 [Lentisphaerae bacterium RIFOXYC12_FULL_60_16]|nr:MAG: hypothetical protein A2498_12775 [Lentisphaerae bacterium RIFOXYC12_FULL_60_16]OGV71186.1 MAG: hypothetical protein A2269_03485 [Lentisphaerae bacterium RIFOXYA12_FULL_60_10]